MKSQVLHTVWCNITGEAAGEIWAWSLLGFYVSWSVHWFFVFLFLCISFFPLFRLFAVRFLELVRFSPTWQWRFRYAVRDGSKIKIFKNFKEKKSFKPDYGAESKCGHVVNTELEINFHSKSPTCNQLTNLRRQVAEVGRQKLKWKMSDLQCRFRATV